MPLITKQYKFCAAHKYFNPKWDDDKNYSVFGDDVRIHGHNYELDITIGGPINEDSGFIIDIMKLKLSLSTSTPVELSQQIDQILEKLSNI